MPRNTEDAKADPSIASRLAEARSRRVLTQRDLAELVTRQMTDEDEGGLMELADTDRPRRRTMSPTTIARIELGQSKPNASTIRKLAKALDCNPEWLANGTGRFDGPRRR